MKLKTMVNSIIAICGSMLSAVFGGWTSGLTTLVVCMTIDYITGLIVAGVFQNSTKSLSGGLESRAGLKGLCRKCLILLYVLIGARIDIALGTTYIKDAVCLGFVCNEILSIVENGGLMGIKYPKALQNALDVLRKKAGEVNELKKEKDDETI